MRRRRSYVERSLASGHLGQFLTANWRRLVIVLAIGAGSGSLPLHSLTATSWGFYMESSQFSASHRHLLSVHTWHWPGVSAGRQVGRTEHARHPSLGTPSRPLFDWVDSLEIEGGDVDHLVIARSGLFAIDSKWHGHIVTREIVRVDELRAEAAARRAQSIMRSLHVPHQVQPIVVVWGGQQGRMTGPSRPQGDTLFLPGRDLKAWLRAQSEGEIISKAEGRAVASKLRRFRNRVRPD